MADKMKYYKLELQNRETNFNKVFKQDFNVGVMKVIKGPSTRPTSNSKAKQLSNTQGPPQKQTTRTTIDRNTNQTNQQPHQNKQNQNH